jgi:hypothetical protein
MVEISVLVPYVRAEFFEADVRHEVYVHQVVPSRGEPCSSSTLLFSR